MPHGEVHKKKFRKNLAIFGLVLLWCLLIWLVTMIRVAHADEGIGGTWRGRSYTGEGMIQHHVDTRGAFFEDRAAHQQKREETQLQWIQDYEAKADARLDSRLQSEEQRDTRLRENIETADRWNRDYDDKAPARLDAREAMEQGREAHQEDLRQRPQQWWDSWTAKHQDDE